MASGQEKLAQKLLSEAVYQEEVNGDLNKAIKTYQQILSQYPDNRKVSAEALLHLGLCYEKLGLDVARQTYRDVISKYSEQADKVAMARDRISRLDAYTSELVAKAEEHFKKGNELFKMWEYESAIKEYENAIESGPNTQLALNARYCIGQSWFKAGKYDAALATFTKLIEENPKSNIAPVTELMVSQVKQTMEKDNMTSGIQVQSDENIITDLKTGITYRKVKTFMGKNDTGNGGNVSPDGRFLVLDNKITPMDGTDVFDLVNMVAARTIYAPDMTKAAFYADSAIWIVPVSPVTGRPAGEPRKLLDGRYRFLHKVSWSPDGYKLVFSRFDNKTEGDIWTIDVLNGKLVPVTNSPVPDYSPLWSPDGKYIAFLESGEERNMCLTSVDNNETKIILKDGGYPYFWSKDSKWIFHSYWEKGLYSLDLGKNFKFDPPPKQVGSFTSFSPDGKKMLFYRSSLDMKMTIKLVSAFGGTSFTPELTDEAYGSQWLPDSKNLIFISQNEQGKIILKRTDLTGDKTALINTEVQVDGTPTWFKALSDFNSIVISIRRADRKTDLYIAPFSINEARITGPARLVVEAWSGRSSSWSRDGKKLAIVRDNDIWVYTIADGKMNKITDTPETEEEVIFSPDGEMISYIIQDAQSGNLHIIPSKGGISRLVKTGCTDAVWSPDSKSFAFLSNNDLQIISLDGNVIKQIANIKNLGIDQVETLLFSPDGKQLAFIGYFDRNEKSVIIQYSLETSKTIRLGYENLFDGKFSLDWSPDGKWLAYVTYEMTKVRPESSLWEADFEEVKEKIAK